MIELFLALLLAFSCPAHNNNHHKNCGHGTTVTTQGDPGDSDDPGTGGDDGGTGGGTGGDSGGDNGHIPPQ